MTNICPGCGAVWLEESDRCESVFNAFLALEFNQPSFYGRVHMLTVACYMIQHNLYSDDALLWIDSQLRAYLQGDQSIAEIRALAGREVQQDKRAWKINRQAGDRPLPKIKWSMTIMDVAGAYQDAESYCDLIIAWARCTLREMTPLLPH